MPKSLSSETREAIARDYEAGFTYAEIRDRHDGVSQTIIAEVAKGCPSYGKRKRGGTRSGPYNPQSWEQRARKANAEFCDVMHQRFLEGKRATYG